jgi:hypothetical protein
METAMMIGINILLWGFIVWGTYSRIKWVITGKGHPLIKDVEDEQK